MQEMETSKKQNSRQQYASDFKEEIIRMLNSGKKVQELSKTFGIGENVLYNWKMKSKTNAKVKTNEEQSNFSLNLISENEKLKKENARLTDERDILKKALGLFSRSS
jgi:transposase